MGSGRDTRTSTLRDLPAVHELVASLNAPHALGVAAARRAIEEQRAAVLAGEASDHDGLLARAHELVSELSRPSLRPVINATGVVVHTNLGRAPLAAAARDALLAAAQGYSNLEIDLELGERGSRQQHVEDLLCGLTGAQAALVVNNGAAAVLLAVAALAGPGQGVVVSRGQLIEIGGGFRIPEVIAQSGARLLEVGTTNRTRLADYRRAIEETESRPAAILHVHQSNFRTLGFVQDVPVAELCTLGAPVIDDVGSGVLADAALVQGLGDEPSIRASVTAGAAIVCCSGDKLLGGPQAGLLVGSGGPIRAAREHPLARAMRIDKLSLAALEGTLRLYQDPERARHEIPVLSMLDAAPEELAGRAADLANRIGAGAEVVPCSGKVGGGALPLLELEGYAVALPGQAVRLAHQLRLSTPPVICRIHDGRALLDVRTVADHELESLGTAVRAAIDAA
jgi:L-seryl-tRNA(Ser) seleniumtransferase